MSTDKNLMMLAEFLEQVYVLPYTHEELLEILSKLKGGYFLSKEEYEMLKSMILGDDEIDGDLLFSGSYDDLTNKPYIPKKLSDLRDYNEFMTIINNAWAELKNRDNSFDERIADNARFISALEVII